MPNDVLPVWARTELVAPDGTSTALESLGPVDRRGVRAGTGPVTVNNSPATALRVTNPSTLAYDIAGRGFTRMRGTVWIENPIADIGATLDPQLRFYVFAAEPNPDRLRPPAPGVPIPSGQVMTRWEEVVDRVFWHALGRPPSLDERRAAARAIVDPGTPARVSPEGLADLLWAVLMKPEFQLIY